MFLCYLFCEKSRTCRFPNDAYDRIWTSFTYPLWENLSTSSLITQNRYRVPVDVMQTAITQLNVTELRIGFSQLRDNPTNQYYIYLHFSEIEELQPGDLRAFDIYINNELWFGNFTPRYMIANTIFSIDPLNKTSINVRLAKGENSTLPPLLNAYEVYVVKELPESESFEQDG